MTVSEMPNRGVAGSPPEDIDTLAAVRAVLDGMAAAWPEIHGELEQAMHLLGRCERELAEFR